MEENYYKTLEQFNTISSIKLYSVIDKDKSVTLYNIKFNVKHEYKSISRASAELKNKINRLIKNASKR